MKVWVEPTKGQDAERVFVLEHGEEVRAKRKVYVPAATAVTVRDKFTIGTLDYWVAGLEEWKEAGTLVYRIVWATEVIE